MKMQWCSQVRKVASNRFSPAVGVATFQTGRRLDIVIQNRRLSRNGRRLDSTVDGSGISEDEREGNKSSSKRNLSTNGRKEVVDATVVP